MTRVLISIDSNLLRRIDERVAEQEYGATRSKFVSVALEYYLTTRYGVSNIIRRAKQ